MSILDKFKLNGKTALVTGCSKGIGQAIAIGLAHAGADIIGISQSSSFAESETALHVRATGKSFLGFQADLSDRKQLYEFLSSLEKMSIVPDILVIMLELLIEHQLSCILMRSGMKFCR